MILQLLSDLHFEMMVDKGKSFINSLDPTGVDVLVLAGDIDSYKNIEDTLKAFAEKYQRSIYLPGNHSFYGNDPITVMKILEKSCKQMPNIDYLRTGKIL